MSIKKSSIFVIAVIVIVTLLTVVNNGDNTMQIDMGDRSMTFSGIDDFAVELAYDDIVSAELVQIDDWASLGGHEFGSFRVGEVINAQGEQYTLFVTTQTDYAVVTTLTDGSRMIFNYNSTGNTESIYEMLLKNVQ